MPKRPTTKTTIECAEAAIELSRQRPRPRRQPRKPRLNSTPLSSSSTGELAEADVQALVLDDKWAATVRGRVLDEANALTLDLVARIHISGSAIPRPSQSSTMSWQTEVNV